MMILQVRKVFLACNAFVNEKDFFGNESTLKNESQDVIVIY